MFSLDTFQVRPEVRTVARFREPATRDLCDCGELPARAPRGCVPAINKRLESLSIQIRERDDISVAESPAI